MCSSTSFIVVRFLLCALFGLIAVCSRSSSAARSVTQTNKNIKLPLPSLRVPESIESDLLSYIPHVKGQVLSEVLFGDIAVASLNLSGASFQISANDTGAVFVEASGISMKMAPTYFSLWKNVVVAQVSCSGTVSVTLPQIDFVARIPYRRVPSAQAIRGANVTFPRALSVDVAFTSGACTLLDLVPSLRSAVSSAVTSFFATESKRAAEDVLTELSIDDILRADVLSAVAENADQFIGSPRALLDAAVGALEMLAPVAGSSKELGTQVLDKIDVDFEDIMGALAELWGAGETFRKKHSLDWKDILGAPSKLESAVVTLHRLDNVNISKWTDALRRVEIKNAAVDAIRQNVSEVLNALEKANITSVVRFLEPVAEAIDMLVRGDIQQSVNVMKKTLQSPATWNDVVDGLEWAGLMPVAYRTITSMAPMMAETVVGVPQLRLSTMSRMRFSRDVQGALMMQSRAVLADTREIDMQMQFFAPSDGAKPASVASAALTETALPSVHVSWYDVRNASDVAVMDAQQWMQMQRVALRLGAQSEALVAMTMVHANDFRPLSGPPTGDAATFWCTVAGNMTQVEFKGRLAVLLNISSSTVVITRWEVTAATGSATARRDVLSRRVVALSSGDTVRVEFTFSGTESLRAAAALSAASPLALAAIGIMGVAAVTPTPSGAPTPMQVAAEEKGSPLLIIIGAVAGVLAVIVGVVVLRFWLVRRAKDAAGSLPANPKVVDASGVSDGARLHVPTASPPVSQTSYTNPTPIVVPSKADNIAPMKEEEDMDCML